MYVYKSFTKSPILLNSPPVNAVSLAFTGGLFGLISMANAGYGNLLRLNLVEDTVYFN